MQIIINAGEWMAEVICSDDPDQSGLWHVSGQTRGTTKVAALAGAQWVLDIFSQGREAFLRVAPEAGTDTDFNTKEESHVGYVRFSFSTKPGEIHHLSLPQSISLGELNHG